MIKRMQVWILAGAAGEFSSAEWTLCADSYLVSILPLFCFTTVACRRPWPPWQECRWQVTPEHAYTHDLTKSEWADYAAVQAECRNSYGRTQPQSSQLTEPLWTDPGLESGISVRNLIRKAQAGNELSNILSKSLHLRKKPPLANDTARITSDWLTDWTFITQG